MYSGLVYELKLKLANISVIMRWNMVMDTLGSDLCEHSVILSG